MITRMLYVNDVTLRAVISGRIEPPFAGTLVLLHGFTGSAESWETFFEEETTSRHNPRVETEASQGKEIEASQGKETEAISRYSTRRFETEASSVSTRGETKGKLWPFPHEDARQASSCELASHQPVCRDEACLRLDPPTTYQFGLPDWRFIAFDLLGHGQSSAPSHPARYTIEACQEDLLAALRQLGVTAGEAVLLGYSLGGRIACYCALSSFFRALILESASPGLATEQERAARRQSDEVLAKRIEREGVTAFVDYWEQLPLFASQRLLPASVWNAQRMQRLNNRPQGLANSLRGAGTGAQPPLHDHLPYLTIPVMLIVGALDGKFCDIAQQMAAALPHAKLHIVPHAGHAVHLEQPAAFAELVREFCIKNEAN